MSFALCVALYPRQPASPHTTMLFIITLSLSHQRHTNAYRLTLPATVATRHTPEDCTADQHFCDDECRPASIRCNDVSECTDGSDEINCTPAYTPSTRRPLTIYPCPMHTCPNGKCYSESERCDGSRDCDDGADEANCKCKRFQSDVQAVPKHIQSAILICFLILVIEVLCALVIHCKCTDNWLTRDLAIYRRK